MARSSTAPRTRLSQWLSNMFASLWYGDAMMPSAHPIVVQRWQRTQGFEPMLMSRHHRIYC